MTKITRFKARRLDRDHFDLDGQWVFGYYFYGYQNYDHLKSKIKKHYIQGYEENGNYFCHEIYENTLCPLDSNDNEIHETDMKDLKKYVNEIFDETELCNYLNITKQELQVLFAVSNKSEELNKAFKDVIDGLYNPYNEK